MNEISINAYRQPIAASACLAALCLALSSGLVQAAPQITPDAAQEAATNVGQAAPTLAAAEEAPQPFVYPPEKGALEFIGSNGHMNGGYGPTNGTALRGMLVTGQGVLQGSLEELSRFGYNGKYGTLSLTRDLSPDYYMMVGAGLGTSELFSRWRVDVTGYRKLGPERRFVVGLGTYYAKGQDSGRSDQGIALSGIAYFDAFVLESGVRFNQANPGLIAGPSQYVAATIGSDDRHALVLSATHTREAYQVLSTGTELANYESHLFSAQWRQRISASLMLLVGGTYYENPYYIRTTGEAGLRWSFR